MAKALVGIVVAVVALSACSTDDSESANRLFVEAVGLIASAEGASAQNKVQNLEQAATALDTIVDRYPTTDLAVELSSGQTIGTVSLLIVETLVREARVQACIESAEIGCIADWLVRSAWSTGEVEFAYDRWSVLGNVVRVTAFEGDLPRAWTIVDTIDDEDSRQSATASIAAAQAHAGQYAEAIATADALGNSYWRVDALVEIAETLARTGQHTEAVRTLSDAFNLVESLEDYANRAHAFLRVAQVQNMIGRPVDAAATLGAAIGIAGHIDDPRTLAYALSDIAEAQVLLGHEVEANETISSAAEIVNSSVDGIYLSISLERIANAQAKTGAFSDALETIENDVLGTARASVLESIAVAQAAMGDFPDALHTADSITTPYNRKMAFAAIARAYAKAGLDVEARRTLARATVIFVPDTFLSASAIGRIAEIEFEMRDLDKAAESMASAILVAESSEETYVHLSSLMSIAIAFANGYVSYLTGGP